MQLRIHEVAKERGVRIAQIQRRTRIPTSTIRRYFFSSRTGLERDVGTLENVSLGYLELIAMALNVEPAELLTRHNTEGAHHEN